MFGGLYGKITKRIDYKKEYKYYDNILDYLDFSPIENRMPWDVRVISFVIPLMSPYSGGHTSILRLGTALADLGYEINYVTYIPQDAESMRQSAETNLKNFKGKCHDVDGLKSIKSDIWVATMWESVYHIKDLEGYKMYFVQDYEPYFYTFGEKFLLAMKTYELGLHMMSLGKWNKEMIERNCSNVKRIDYVDFPYEKKEYLPVERNFKGYGSKNKFEMAVYLKNSEKRAPFILQNMLGRVKNELERDGICLQINYFGEDKFYNFKHGNSLGKLTKQQLYELYCSSDFGLVASLTNISLVPYEMIATNLPVIEFKEGTFSYFFGDDAAIMTSFNWRELYEKLKYYMKNTDELAELTENAAERLKGLSWEKSAAQFHAVIEKYRGLDK